MSRGAHETAEQAEPSGRRAMPVWHCDGGHMRSDGTFAQRQPHAERSVTGLPRPLKQRNKLPRRASDFGAGQVPIACA